jgi:hypothetical protein
MQIYYPTPKHPFVMPMSNVSLRIACSAGINRSATVREFLAMNMYDNCDIYYQYGAKYGDGDAKAIYAHDTTGYDGFCEVFDLRKKPNIQKVLFEMLGHTFDKKATLPESSREKYKQLLNKHFWNIKPLEHNIFIIINDKQSVVDLVIKRLAELGEDVDLIVINLKDSIYDPPTGIKAQSKEAYDEFLDKIEPLFVFSEQ